MAQGCTVISADSADPEAETSEIDICVNGKSFHVYIKTLFDMGRWPGAKHVPVSSPAALAAGRIRKEKSTGRTKKQEKTKKDNERRRQRPPSSPPPMHRKRKRKAPELDEEEEEAHETEAHERAPA